MVLIRANARLLLRSGGQNRARFSTAEGRFLVQVEQAHPTDGGSRHTANTITAFATIIAAAPHFTGGESLRVPLLFLLFLVLEKADDRAGEWQKHECPAGRGRILFCRGWRRRRRRFLSPRLPPLPPKFSPNGRWWPSSPMGLRGRVRQLNTARAVRPVVRSAKSG